MKSILAKSGIAIAFGATALASAAPAQAQRYDRYGSHHRGGNSTGTAIVAGIAGLAIGAAIASSTSNRDRRVYDDRYDGYRPDVYNGYDARQGYYQDGYRDNGYRDNGYAYRGGYDGYDRAPVCTVQRSWDRYSHRSVLVRVCR